MDSSVVYKKDIKFCIKGNGCYDGLGIVPNLSEYHLEISPTEEDQIDRIVFNSCHRNKGFYPESGDLSFLDYFTSWFKDKRRGFKYSYFPSQTIEDKANCPLYIFILDSESETNAWAVMIPEDPRFKLKATDRKSACRERV